MPAGATAERGMRRLKTALVLGLLFLAGFLLYRTLSGYSPGEIAGSLREIPLYRLLLALVCAAASYFCLSWFDWMAARYAGMPLAYRRAALASFVSLSLGHNIGFGALSSGAVRYRFYSRWGMNAEQVARVVLFCGVTIGLGLMVTGGLALLLRPDLAARLTGLGDSSLLALGAFCLALALVYLLLAAVLRRKLRLGRWSFEMPSPGLAAGQIVAGSVNFAFVAGCLYQGMAASADISYFAAATAFVTANTMALITQVPGGLGVIESVVLFLLPQAQVIGALVVFRVSYFLIPLVIGGTLFAVLEGRRLLAGRRRENGGASGSSGRKTGGTGS